jgi:hypothetical protein
VVGTEGLSSVIPTQTCDSINMCAMRNIIELLAAAAVVALVSKQCIRVSSCRWMRTQECSASPPHRHIVSAGDIDGVCMCKGQRVRGITMSSDLQASALLLDSLPFAGVLCRQMSGPDVQGLKA